MTLGGVAGADAPATKEEKRNAIVEWLANDLPKIEPDYGTLVIRSVYRACAMQVHAGTGTYRQNSAEQEAADNYVLKGESVRDLMNTYDWVNESFKTQVRVLQTVCETVSAFQNIDLLRQTAHGQKALALATKKGQQAVEAVEYAWTRNTEYRPLMRAAIAEAKRDGDAFNEPISLELGRAAAMFEAVAELVIMESTEAMLGIKQDIEDALQYEMFKAYAKKKPDELSSAVATAEKVAGHLMGGLEVSSGAIPVETAKKIVEGAHAVGGALLAIAFKAAKSGAANQQVKKIMDDKDLRAEAEQYLNDHPLRVAKYLEQKYVANIKHNMTMVNVASVGVQLALTTVLEGVGLGTIAGKVLGLLWKVVRETVVTVAEKTQEARVEAAREVVRQMRPEDPTKVGETLLAVGSAAAKVFDKDMAGHRGQVLHDVQDATGDLQKEVVKAGANVLDEITKTVRRRAGENVFSVISPEEILFSTLFDALGSLVSWVMDEIKVDPAQTQVDVVNMMANLDAALASLQG
jgi:hypothetical protein